MKYLPVYLRKYNLSELMYNELVEEQNGKCKICKKTKRLVVDHCHKTNVVRGLLCYPCNMLLGFAYESQRILQAALNYVKITRF